MGAVRHFQQYISYILTSVLLPMKESEVPCENHTVFTTLHIEHIN